MKVLAYIESDKTDKVYQIRVGKDFKTYCTCPAWAFSKHTPKKCKHLDRYMVGEVEEKPLTWSGKSKGDFNIRRLLLD